MMMMMDERGGENSVFPPWLKGLPRSQKKSGFEKQTKFQDVTKSKKPKLQFYYYFLQET